MKMALEGISKALFGDEDGDGTSIKAMIAEKNEQIETLKTENAEQQKQIASLEEKATQLAEAIKVLIETVGKVESNSDTSLKLSEETALQILQLLNIAMDRKVPITTAEARQIWYEHTQNRIKTIYEEGLGNGKNKDEQEV
jgi:transcriptional regulator with XRE-family HTH domain